MALLSVALLSPGYAVALAQEAQQQNAAPAEEAPKIPNAQLDSLVAPIARASIPIRPGTLLTISRKSKDRQVKPDSLDRRARALLI